MVTKVVNEAVATWTVLQKVWGLLVVVIVGCMTLYGTWTFVTKTAPEALAAHEVRLEAIEGVTAVNSDRITDTQEQHVEDMSELNTNMRFMVCSRRQRDLQLRGAPATQNCEEIYLPTTDGN